MISLNRIKKERNSDVSDSNMRDLNGLNKYGMKVCNVSALLLPSENIKLHVRGP